MTTPKVKIGYIIQQFPPEVGAGSARAAELGTRWVEDGADLRVVTAMPNRPVGRIYPEYRGHLFSTETWQGIRVYRSWLYASPKHGFLRTILNNLTFMLTAIVQGVRHLRDRGVVIASSPPFFPHIAGVIVSRVRRVPLVLEIRDLWPDYLVGMGAVKGVAARGLFAIERWLLRQATRVVVVTPSFRARMIEKGVPAGRIAVIPNGVDLHKYCRTDEASPIALGDAVPDRFVVGYLGNFGASQALGDVLDAAVLLANEAPRVRFVLVGDGTDRQSVVRKAEELRLDNLVLHPPIGKSDTRAFYNACDACLVPLAAFPILEETVPSKMFEIMACERPVVASLGGEGRRVVEESKCGLVGPAGDARAMADNVKKIAALDDATRGEMGRSGRAYVAAHYSRDQLAGAYFVVLQEVQSDGTSGEDT